MVAVNAKRGKFKRENSAAVGLAVERMLCCWNMAGLLHDLDIQIVDARSAYACVHEPYTLGVTDMWK